jgi:hypothetical protein
MFIKAGSIGPAVTGRKGPQGELVKPLWMSPRRQQAETEPNSSYQCGPRRRSRKHAKELGVPDGKRLPSRRAGGETGA